MIPGHIWVRDFSVRESDVEYLINLLLEREIPLSREQLALALIEAWLTEEAAALQERYKDALSYNPAHSYEVGQRLIFSTMDYATAVVVDTRPGNNPEYGEFSVISVEFDEAEGATKSIREFAADLTTSHVLSRQDGNGSNPLTAISNLSAEEILQADHDDIVASLEEYLEASDNLVEVSNKWFPRDLILEVDEGVLNLVEAVLDIAGGGPLPSEEIFEQIGGMGNSPMELQVFSLNYTLNMDERFDEVGSYGEVLWYLSRMEPPEVRKPPAMLRYESIEYDRSLLSPDMLELETEIGDELSPLSEGESVDEATITLPYPHRRSGTLPLNVYTSHIFPGGYTSRIWVTLVDGQDGEEYTGWVVHNERYVYGLERFYDKHSLPIGVHLTVRKGDEPDKVIVDFQSHRPRTEWIRLITSSSGQISFENNKRSIGAEYDDLMILGADDLEAVDILHQEAQQSKKGLSDIMTIIIPALGRLTPQGTAHVKTLYSAVNVLYRCPPGPIFATLVANPDFEDLGGHYWKLSNR